MAKTDSERGIAPGVPGLQRSLAGSHEDVIALDADPPGADCGEPVGHEGGEWAKFGSSRSARHRGERRRHINLTR